MNIELSSVIKSVYLDSKDKIPHVVLGLSNNWVNSKLNNCIILYGISFYKINGIPVCDYSHIDLGKNIIDSFHIGQDINDYSFFSISVPRVRNNYVAIITHYHSVKSLFPEIECLYKGNPDFILLSLITTCGIVSDYEPWSKDFITEADYSMYNQVTKKTGHFDTKGSVYSFGLHGQFSKPTDVCTISNYCLKSKTYKSGLIRNRLQKCCILNLQDGINALATIHPCTKKIIAPFCTILEKRT